MTLCCAVWLPVSLLFCISRQLHRQPEQLLLHQRQGPNQLQEPQKPVSLLWPHVQIINRRFFFVFFLQKLRSPAAWISSSKVREANSHITGARNNHFAISLMDLFKMLFVLCTSTVCCLIEYKVWPSAKRQFCPTSRYVVTGKFLCSTQCK